MKKELVVAIIALTFFTSVVGQTRKFTLSDAVATAKKQSLEAKSARNNANFALWNYKSYTSTFLPKLILQGTLPEYYRTINSVTQPNGEIRFVGQNVASSALSMNLMQNLRATGGQLAIGSNLSRVDNFGSYKIRNYTSVPLMINYAQRNIFYNDFKWTKKIEPLKVREARSQYLENMETIGYTTVVRFFDLLIATNQLALDIQNVNNLDTLSKLTIARSELGTVTRNEVLQAKISLISAKTSLSGSKMGLQSARQILGQYLNEKNDIFELVVPESLIFFKVDRASALLMAHKNRKYVQEFSRRRLEAEQSIAKAKADYYPTVDFRLNLGVTQTGNTFSQSYQQLYRNQGLTLNFSIPVLDWGVNRISRRRAEIAFEMEKSLMLQQENFYDQEISMMIDRWELQEDRLELATSFQLLAKQRYDIALQKYGVGGLTFTDFNNAQIDKDKSKIEYINCLRDYWLTYYSIRAMTLYDFETKAEIEGQTSMESLEH